MVSLYKTNSQEKVVEQLVVIAEQFKSYFHDGAVLISKGPLRDLINFVLQAFFGFQNNVDLCNEEGVEAELSPDAMKTIILFFQKPDFNVLAPTCIFEFLQNVATSNLEAYDRGIACLLLFLQFVSKWSWMEEDILSARTFLILASIILKYWGQTTHFGKISVLDLAVQAKNLEIKLLPYTTYLVEHGGAALIGTPEAPAFSKATEEELFSLLAGLQFVNPDMSPNDMVLLWNTALAIKDNDSNSLEESELSEKSKIPYDRAKSNIEGLLAYANQNTDMLTLMLKDADVEGSPINAHWKFKLTPATFLNSTDKNVIKLLDNADLKSAHLFQNAPYDPRKVTFTDEKSRRDFAESLGFAALSDMEKTKKKKRHHDTEPKLRSDEKEETNELAEKDEALKKYEAQIKLLKEQQRDGFRRRKRDKKQFQNLQRLYNRCFACYDDQRWVIQSLHQEIALCLQNHPHESQHAAAAAASPEVVTREIQQRLNFFKQSHPHESRDSTSTKIVTRRSTSASPKQSTKSVVHRSLSQHGSLSLEDEDVQDPDKFPPPIFGDAIDTISFDEVANRRRYYTFFKKSKNMEWNCCGLTGEQFPCWNFDGCVGRKRYHRRCYNRFYPNRKLDEIQETLEAKPFFCCRCADHNREDSTSSSEDEDNQEKDGKMYDDPGLRLFAPE